jgi:hypothetical protein
VALILIIVTSHGETHEALGLHVTSSIPEEPVQIEHIESSNREGSHEFLNLHILRTLPDPEAATD